MFDNRLRPLVDPTLTALARAAIARGVTADAITMAGCAFGLAGAALIASGAVNSGLVFFLIGRALDGLDGTVARLAGPTDRGGFLDITLDFWVYAAIPLAFAILDPAANALATAFLLASFLANAVAFFAFALLTAGRDPVSRGGKDKAFIYLAGLAEGPETILAFVCFCLWPAAFPVLASLFAGVCLVSAAGRIVMGWRALSGASLPPILPSDPRPR